MKRQRLTSDFDPKFHEKVERGKRLNMSSPFDYHLWSDADEVEALVEELHKLFVEHTKPGRIQRKTDLPNIRVLVLNLFKAHSLKPGWYVAYSRNSSGYRSRGRYNKCDVTRKMVSFIDAFAELGLVEGVKGYYVRSNPVQSKNARVRATSRLIAKFEDEYCLDPAMISRHEEQETVILKSPKEKGKKLVDYKDTPDTILMRDNLTKINDLFLKSSIELDLTVEQWEDLNTRLINTEDEHKRKEPLDTSRVHLHRTFNDSRFDHGGRFYGGWWQNVFSEYRPHIVINGLHTTEVDYSSLHPRILYALEKLQPPIDSYEIEGLSRKHRKLIKSAFLRMINAYHYEAAKRSLLNDSAELLKAVEGGVDTLFEKIRDTHKAICKHFYTGIGTKLQYLDSQVAEAVMLYFVEKDVPILPIHDSFIVPEFYEIELREVMESEFEKAFEVTGIAESKDQILRYVDLSSLLIPMR